MTAPPTDSTPGRGRMPRGAVVLIVAVVAVILSPILLMTVISLQNDAAAHDVENRLTALPLPPGTERVASFSKAGKLSGNGNGMQYLGAMLIDSDLSLDRLGDYYAEQAKAMDEGRTSEYPVTIGVDEAASSALRDARGVDGFLAQADAAGTFVVYVWGDAPSPLHAEVDLRGH